MTLGEFNNSVIEFLKRHELFDQYRQKYLKFGKDQIIQLMVKLFDNYNSNYNTKT